MLACLVFMWVCLLYFTYCYFGDTVYRVTEVGGQIIRDVTL